MEFRKKWVGVYFLFAFSYHLKIKLILLVYYMALLKSKIINNKVAFSKSSFGLINTSIIFR